MAGDESENGKSQEELKGTGTEFHSHMTNDGAPGSHSELFGLGAKDGEGDSKTEDHKKPGDAIIDADKGRDTSGGGSEPTPAQPETKTGPMADGSTDNTPPGAGSTQATPEQGSGKV